MYTYKCYYHPKDDSVQSCRGCKLPLCATCDSADGFCSECTLKRNSVLQLRQMRQVMASSAVKGASTTGRLRLARRQMAESGQRAPVARGMVGPTFGSGALSPERSLGQLGTRPLKEASRSEALASAPGANKPVQRHVGTREAEPRAVVEPQPRRYNPEAVAYRPAGANRQAAPTKNQTAPASPRANPGANGDWFKPFAVGLAVGAALAMAFVMGRVSGHAPQPAAADTAVDSTVAAGQAPRAAQSGHAALVWLAPASGTTLHGLQYLHVRVTAPAKLSSLVLLVDGQPKTSTTSVAVASELMFETHGLANGAHTLQIKGYAWEKAIAVSGIVTVRIAN